MSEEKPRKLKASGLPRISVPEQDPARRATNFEEVPYGISLEAAMDEASRCMQCPKPRCIAACPVNIRIPEFIAEIAKGDPKAAALKLKNRPRSPQSAAASARRKTSARAAAFWESAGNPWQSELSNALRRTTCA